MQFTPYPYWRCPIWTFVKEIYSIPEKYISLLQFTKYTMVTWLLKCVWKGVEQTFKILNFMHMNFFEIFHPTNDVMSDLSKLYFRFVRHRTDFVKYLGWKEYQSDTFYDLFLFIASIWTYFMYLFCQEGVVICFIAIQTRF